MKKIRKLVFATNNLHKLDEARQIISDDFEIVSLSDIGCHDEIPETADTLEGNALIKARWVHDKYGVDCFADDTGLMVDSLDGAPGVMSARYAGEHCTPADNVAKLLDEMKDKSNRDAHFSTVVALIADGREHCFEGRVDGSIAREPHGSGGFGYDPVFVEKESGKCFAEMSAEDKNAVSHRGRALRKLRDFLGVMAVIVLTALASFTANAAQWRLHPSYDGQIISVYDTPDFVYYLGAKQQYDYVGDYAPVLHGVLFCYDKKGDELTYLNSQNKLSGNTVKAIAYNYSDKCLAIAYDDGTIDLLYDSGFKKPIFGLKAADTTLDKIINDFTFDFKERRIYAASNFGYLIINGDKGEIETSRVFNKKFNSAIKFADRIWLAAEDGLYYGSRDDFNLENFEKILDGEFVQNLTVIGDNLYLTTRNGNNMLLHRVSMDNGVPTPALISSDSETSFNRGSNSIVTVSGSKIRYINQLGDYMSYTVPDGYYGLAAASYDGRSFWFSSNRRGFSNLRRESDGKWTVLKDRFFPNASSAFQCSSIKYHPEYGMLVRNHGYDYPFALNKIITTYDLISGYKDMTWSRLSTTYRGTWPGLNIDSPFGISIDPNNTDHVYCGSELTGMLRLDLKNPENSIHFTKPSDFLGGNGQHGFVAVVPDNPAGTWAQQCVFAAPQFDSYGNLWTAYVNPEPGQIVSSYTELWIWPPAARAATTSYKNVQGFQKIKISDMVTGNEPVILPLMSPANKNIVLHHGNTVDGAMLILDHNGTIDNRSDDRMAKMKSVTDQDGERVTFSSAFALYEDTSTGLVWVSGGNGIFTFNPVEALKDPTSVRRIKVARNDGTNLADYLLDGVIVKAITSDPSGRKWFGTIGAGLVCTSSDGRQILATYTRDNSELPGDDVYAIAYNPSNGSMMISTDNGLCELFLDGTAQEGGSDVKVYPNPVRPDYYGYITIEGLPQDAMVKIVDASGNLIKELGQSFNGSIQWDATNMAAKRVFAGVYFVVATNGPDADAYNKMAKILVVN